jgi:hypothetical protein
MVFAYLPGAVTVDTVNTYGNVLIGGEGATLQSTFHNHGNLTFSGPVGVMGTLNNYDGASVSFQGAFGMTNLAISNSGNFNVQGGAQYATSGAMSNNGSLSVQVFAQFWADSLTNGSTGQVQSMGGSLQINGDLANNGGWVNATAGGSINVNGNFTNSGEVQAFAGGRFWVEGDFTNSPGGQFEVASNSSVSVEGSFTNAAGSEIWVEQGGSLNSGDFTNEANATLEVSGNASLGDGLGIINKGSIWVGTGGSLSADGNFINNAGASMQVGGRIGAGGDEGGGFINNGSLMVTPGGGIDAEDFLINNTHITLYMAGAVGAGGGDGADGNFTNSAGASITGSGVLYGMGSLTNAGTIKGQYGNLTLLSFTGTITNTGSISNAPGTTLTIDAPAFVHQGQLTVNAGGAVDVTCAFSDSNGSSIKLLGGILSAPTFTHVAGATLNGFGGITGDFINEGNAVFYGATNIAGNVTNAPGAVLLFQNQQSLIDGNVVNNGTIKTTGTLLAVTGSYSGAGAFISDPSDNYFQDVTIEANGLFQGGVGDRFFIAGQLTNSGTVSLQGAVLATSPTSSQAVSLKNDGLLHLSGGSYTLGTLTSASAGVSSGIVQVDSNASLSVVGIRQDAVTVNGTLTIRGSSKTISEVNALAIDVAGGAMLDLDSRDDGKGNGLVVYGGNASSIRAWIASGVYNGTNGWYDGPGINSSVAANDSEFLISVGMVDNGALGWWTGTDWDPAVNLPDTNNVLVKVTWGGDTDLDGDVDADDQTQWIDGFNHVGTGWEFGDFDWDGDVDADDQTVWLDGYTKTNTVGPMAPGELDGAGAIPEPGTLVLVGLGLAALLGRRRSRKA